MGIFAPVILLIATIAFSWVLGDLFLSDVLVTLLNGAIIYFLLYRAYFDLQKGRWKPYLIGLVIGAVLVYLMPPLDPIWDITLVLLLVFCSVEIMRMFHNKKRRKQSGSR